MHFPCCFGAVLRLEPLTFNPSVLGSNPEGPPLTPYIRYGSSRDVEAPANPLPPNGVGSTELDVVVLRVRQLTGPRAIGGVRPYQGRRPLGAAVKSGHCRRRDEASWLRDDVEWGRPADACAGRIESDWRSGREECEYPEPSLLRSQAYGRRERRQERQGRKANRPQNCRKAHRANPGEVVQVTHAPVLVSQSLLGAV